MKFIANKSFNIIKGVPAGVRKLDRNFIVMFRFYKLTNGVTEYVLIIN